MHAKFRGFAVLTGCVAIATVATTAHAATYVVPGTANPFLAGAASGDSVTMNGFTDTVPGEAPIAIAVSAGETVEIGNVTGMVSNCPQGCGSYGPAGGPATGSAPVTASGFTEIVSPYASLPINSLIGVFDASASNAAFLIGNGGSFVVPTGATTLYLATVDSYQWANNVGAFTVNVAAVPEPASWLTMLAGFCAIGMALRTRPARPAVRRLAAGFA